MFRRLLRAYAFQCFYCGAWFDTETALAAHMSKCGYDKRK